MDFAAKVRDWPLLQQAIALKLNEQEDFVNWWEGAVTVNHGAGRGNKNNSDPCSFSKSDAESETGISQQQVSRWRKRLKDRDKSEKELFETFYKRGMARTDIR